MSVRPPNLFKPKSPMDGNLGILDGEIMAEMAASIGRAGKTLEASLERLEQAGDETSADEREELLQKAARAAWALLTQYELCGLSTQTNLVKRYRIPREVVIRIGALPKRDDKAGNP